MGDRRHDEYSSTKRSNSDEPPNSRIFIISSKNLEEDDFREAFSKFGNIEELWIVKDRNTGEKKGTENFIIYCAISSINLILLSFYSQFQQLSPTLSLFFYVYKVYVIILN